MRRSTERILTTHVGALRFPGSYAWADANSTLSGYLEDSYFFFGPLATQPVVTGPLRYRPEAIKRAWRSRSRRFSARLIPCGQLAPGKSRCRPDMADAGRPGGVIGLVVLRAERGEPEFPGGEPVRDREVFRDEQEPPLCASRGHPAAFSWRAE